MFDFEKDSIIINCEESLAEKTEEIMKKCDDLLKTSIGAYGDAALDLDAETGAIVGGCMEIYKDSKDLAIMQAKTIDKMAKDLDELKKILQEINKKLGK